MFFERFIYTQMLHEVLDFKHKKTSFEKKIFLDIFQPAHDRKLASIARKMKNAGLIGKTFVRPNGLTMVVPKDSTERVRIYDIEDLEAFANGRDINEFDVSQTNLEEA